MIEFVKVWPLHRDHYLTIPEELLQDNQTREQRTEPPKVTIADYHAILEACTEHWQTVRQIRAITQLSSATQMCIYLLRGVQQGTLEREKIRERWAYRKISGI